MLIFKGFEWGISRGIYVYQLLSSRNRPSLFMQTFSDKKVEGVCCGTVEGYIHIGVHI